MRPRTRLAPVVVCCALALVVGAAGGHAQDAGANTYAIGAAPPALRLSVDEAEVLIVEIHGMLLTELRSKINKGGPLLALRVCHSAAVAFRHRVRVKGGVAAGITSARLRNPGNAPPPWARSIVASRSDGPASAQTGFVVDLGDRVGVLRPIAEQALCSTCHGPANRIPGDVAAELTARYPHDRGTGIKEGEIRGWYWVVLPRIESSNNQR